MSEKKEPNPKGPIFIRKSFGYGWTLNFQRTESYWIIGILIIALAIFVSIKRRII